MSYVTRYEYNESKTIVTVSKYNRKIIETKAKLIPLLINSGEFSYPLPNMILQLESSVRIGARTVSELALLTHIHVYKTALFPALVQILL